MKRLQSVSTVSLFLLFWGFAGGALLSQTEGPDAPGEETRTENSGAAVPAAGARELPPGVVARIDGRDITVQGYAEYLLASLGKSKLDEYIDRLLIEEEASRRGITVEPGEVESLVEERIRRDTEALYQGSRERLLEALEEQRTTLEERKARLRQELYYDRLLEKLVLDERKVTEEDVRREFERLYGPNGERLELRHILVSTRPRVGPDGETLQRSEGEARERAEAILAELRAGADFTEAVKKFSDDTLTRRNEGRIASYRKGVYGAEFDAAVEKLGESRRLSGVVRSPRGFHIIRWVGRDATRLEDVRGSIEDELRRRPATREEKDALIVRLRERAEIVR